MNIVSPHTILTVRRGPSGLCDAGHFSRRWKGIPILPKPIGLAGDEDPPCICPTSLQLPPLLCHRKPLHPLFFPVHEKNNGKSLRNIEGKGVLNRIFQKDLLRHLYICTVSTKPLKTSMYLLLMFDSLHARSSVILNH